MSFDADAQNADHALQTHLPENKGKLEPAFAVTIACDRAEAFEAWQQSRSRGNSEFELEIEPDGAEAGHSINFASPPGVSTPFSGQFRFDDASGGRGTTITATLHVDRTAGKLEKLFATWRGHDPALLLRRDMRRLKQLVETGEIATNAQTLAAAAKQKGIE